MIRWSRYEMPHPCREKREWTRGRVAAARRAVQREKDKVPLFPDLAKYQTVEERITERDEDEAALRARMRQHRADLWRKTRRAIHSLPQLTKLGLITYWNECGCPPDPLYLLQILRDTRHESPWRKLRALRMLKKISQTKDPAKRAELVSRLPS